MSLADEKEIGMMLVVRIRLSVGGFGFFGNQ
jgi:hypothetical protein